VVNITIQGDRVLFRVEGLHKLWAMRSELDIPLAHVVGVEINHEQIGRWWHGFKLIGTDVPVDQQRGGATMTECPVV
jgi:hypothetical protein